MSAAIGQSMRTPSAFAQRISRLRNPTITPTTTTRSARIIISRRMNTVLDRRDPLFLEHEALAILAHELSAQPHPAPVGADFVARWDDLRRRFG